MSFKSIAVLCAFHIVIRVLPGAVFDARINSPTNGKNIPVGVSVRANVEIYALRADIDKTKYEICVTMKVINSKTTRRWHRAKQSLELNIETRTPGLVKFGLWVQNYKTEILASNVEEIALYAMNYTTGRESSINQTLLYHKCLASGLISVPTIDMIDSIGNIFCNKA